MRSSGIRHIRYGADEHFGIVKYRFSFDFGKPHLQSRREMASTERQLRHAVDRQISHRGNRRNRASDWTHGFVEPVFGFFRGNDRPSGTVGDDVSFGIGIGLSLEKKNPPTLHNK
ncbi:Pregnancy-associated glycoprotein [Trichinella spiralis]|uniref:Pregnancy-associated glycoprotein n=1 Tax=Trichinella spiralis TaxID=6334 RepID=A0ABR3KYM2_TRISP